MKANLKLVFLSFIGMCLFLESCYESTEGCIDRLSTNYDVTVDNGCSDCCVYPELDFGLNNMFGNETFSRSDTLTLGTLGEYNLINASFYLSDFYLLMDTHRLSPQSTFDFLCNLDTLEIGQLRYNNSITTAVPSFPHFGSYSGVGFKLGLPDCFQALSTSDELSFSSLLETEIEQNNNDYLLLSVNFKSSSPIKSDTTNIEIDTISIEILDSMLIDSIWVVDTTYRDSIVIEYEIDEVFDTLQYHLASQNQEILGLDFEKDSLASNDIGENISLSLNLDYEQWFQQINWNEDSTQVSENLYKSLSTSIFLQE